MWLGIIRTWRPVLAWWALVCLAAVCGAGKDGTGPNGGGSGQYAGGYLLAGAKEEAVPTVVVSNACAPATIVKGGLTVTRGARRRDVNPRPDSSCGAAPGIAGGGAGGRTGTIP